MLVVNNELVAVAKRVLRHVRGDGKKTIAELVEVNSDPGAASAMRRCLRTWRLMPRRKG